MLSNEQSKMALLLAIHNRLLRFNLIHLLDVLYNPDDTTSVLQPHRRVHEVALF